MFVLIGLAVVFALVFGGYTLAGGKLGIILYALPYEMMMIGGSAVGTFLMANDTGVIKRTVGDVVLALKGPHHKKPDYESLLCLLFEILRMARTDPLALEAQIEDPHASELFGRYPGIAHDAFAMAMIVDTMRYASMQVDDPHQVDELIERDLEIHHAEMLRPAEALQSTADALPALGIVAAVLGVIKTMASIDQPPAVLGKMIGGALVGTFLGIFLSYCLAGPLAARIKAIHDQDHAFYKLIRDVLRAHLQRHPPHVCAEIGRKNAPPSVRPSFGDVEQAINALKAQATRKAA